MYDKPVLGVSFLFLFFFSFLLLKKNLRSTTWLGAMSYLRVQVSCDRGRRNYRLERSNGMLRCNAMGRMMGERWRLSIRTGAGPLLFLFLFLSLNNPPRRAFIKRQLVPTHSTQDIHTYTPPWWRSMSLGKGRKHATKHQSRKKKKKKNQSINIPSG
jgi:hypothetical protein